MIKDINNPDIGAVVKADICIVGAGAAGISIAHKLMGSGLQVVMLESGGFNYEPETEGLNQLTLNDNIDANVEGTKYNRDRSCRLRYFGGTTNHWAGWCRPLDELDFKTRKWVPGSGWPISKDDLESYYSAAEEYCDLVNPLFDPTLNSIGAALPQFSAEKIKSVHWALSPPTRFGSKYQEQLAGAKDVSVLLHANVVEITTNGSGSTVSELRVRSLKGKQIRVVAKKFIIACGALENARLLLSSNRQDPKGVGNQSQMVGKNYQNHPHIHTAIIRAADPDGLSEIYQTQELESGSRLKVGIAASEVAQEQAEILNFGATISPVVGRSNAREMWNDITAFKMPDDFSYKVKSVIGDLLKQSKNIEHQVYMYTEQAPSKASQIVLMDDVDAVGMPRIRIDWQLNELDKHTVQAATQLIAEEVGRLNIGRLRVKDWVMEDSQSWPPSMWGGCHHIGTTRMSSEASDGVVDSNCKVHDVDNLYIAGSSVFRTGGHAPPTFTIVALALRLADHLVAEKNQQI